MVLQILNKIFEHKPMVVNKDVDKFNFFWLSVAGYCIFIYQLFGHYILDGEMFAEAAVIYYRNADGTISQFLVRDAGYLVWPQQVIVLIGHILAIPSYYIPYFYDGVATLISGALVFSFCSTFFRSLISSDFFRLIICISVAMIGDVDVRMFINFTYYSAFFLTILFATMIIIQPKKVPWFAWTMPIFFIAKPAILALGPLVLISLIYSRNSFRVICWLCLVGIGIQIINVYLSSEPQTSAPTLDQSLDRLLVTIEQIIIHVSGIWQSILIIKLPYYLKLLTTVLTFGGLFYVMFTWKNPSKILMVFGIILIVATNFIVSAGLQGGQYEYWKHLAGGIHLFRWTIIQVFGIILIASVLCIYVSEKIADKFRFFLKPWLLFIGWLILSSWGWVFIDSVTPPTVQYHTSAWKNNHDEAVFDTVCTSIKPLGWVYSADNICKQVGKINIHPIVKYLSANEPIALLRPEGSDDSLVQSVILVYLLEKGNEQNHKISLNYNGQILTREFKFNTGVGKINIVQFNLPEPIFLKELVSISMASTVPIHVDVELDKTPNQAHAQWYLKK